MLAFLLFLLLQSTSSRSANAKHRFMVATGYPHGRSGYVVDHVIPLCAGGPDDPSNMQWQRADVSQRKDQFEKQLCAAMKREGFVLVKKP